MNEVKTQEDSWSSTGGEEGRIGKGEGEGVEGEELSEKKRSNGGGGGCVGGAPEDLCRTQVFIRAQKKLTAARSRWHLRQVAIAAGAS